MSYTLSYELKMDFANDLDKDPKNHFQTFMRGENTSSSFELYKSVCKWLIAQAGTFKFIDAEIGDLKIKSDTPNEEITFDLTDAAKAKWTTEKANVLLKFADFIKDPTRVIGTREIFKPDRFKELKEILDKQGGMPSPDPYLLAAEFLKVYEYNDALQKLFDKTVSEETLKERIAEFLNLPPTIIHYELKRNLIICLINPFFTRAKEKSADGARINLLRSKIGLPVLTTPYTSNFDTNLTDVKNHLISMACPASGASTIPLDLFTSKELLFFKEIEKVISPALAEFKIFLMAHTYQDELLQINRNNFGTYVAESINNNVNVLSGLVTKIMDNIEVSVNSASGPATTYYLYSFYNLRSYLNKLAYGKQIRDNTMLCQYNTLDIPLISQDGDKLFFYNTGNHIYFYQTGTNIAKFDTPIAKSRLAKNFNYQMFQPGYTSEQSAILTDWMQFRFESSKSKVEFDRGMNIVFSRNYYPFYAYSSTENKIFSHIIFPLTSGSGNSMGRCQQIDEANFKWRFSGNIDNLIIEANTVLRSQNILEPITFTDFHLAAYIGIEKKENEANSKASLTRNGENFILDEFDEFITLQYTDGNLERYYLCNLPYVPIHGLRKKEVAEGDRLKNFQFLYYRLAKLSDKDPDLISYMIEKPSGDKKKYVNLPVALQYPNNYATIKHYKDTVGVIKNKGNFLGTSRNMRESAGSVMAGIVPFYKFPVTGNPSNLSANEFCKSVLKYSNEALTSWQRIKSAGLAGKPVETEQEWCHLLGHGDGGDERVGNFVCGSYDCNTEQLAIETGQRLTTQASANRNLYMLKSSAYLLDDRSMKVIEPQKTYLGTTILSVLKKAYNGVIPVASKEQNEEDVKNTALNAPVVSFIRYKIFKRTKNKDNTYTPFVKVFDYVFEGQSEFFDVNQFNIISKTVSYVLNKEAFWKDFYNFFY
ncbi:hypothetical protein SAMN05518672_11517 [Chitinophaga sp. CF118]|uniref:hypothetical protein n=1 Tax=Chitinophaga sp. CF118 TaxID=1884367 RepID=UPI0008E45CAC|nr:hypothetical protein [Chitinophaga sp. CF118]SFF06126.1 hypothetical protein SAMN05518672_11517 [Chitinophaga sp. CF118]